MNNLVHELIDELRSIFQADGADLLVQSANETAVELQLVQTAEKCDMCNGSGID